MRLLSLVLLLCVSLAVPAQAPEPSCVRFTPESLFQAISERSSVIRLGNLVVDEAQASVAVAKTALLPDISASWQVGYLGDGYLTSRGFRDGMRVSNPHFVNNFGLEAMQLIYSGGAVSGSIRLAELGRRMAQLSLAENRQQVRFVLLSHLIDLECLRRQQAVIDSNIYLAGQLLETMRARFDEGVVLRSDITRYELQIADLQLRRDRIAESIDNLNHHIATALDYPAGTSFSLDVEALSDDYPMPAPDQWQQLAASQSIALEKARLGIDMSRTGLSITRADRLPHLGAFVYGRFDSPVTIEVPVLNKNFMYWGFGLNVSYSLSSLFKTNRSEAKARVAIDRSRQELTLAEESLSDNINDACTAWRTACSELRTQRSSLRLAQQNYEIVADRFSEGMALVTDLVDAANVRIAAQTGIETAQSRLLYCLYKLQYLSNSL